MFGVTRDERRRPFSLKNVNSEVRSCGTSCGKLWQVLHSVDFCGGSCLLGSGVGLLLLVGKHLSHPGFVLHRQTCHGQLARWSRASVGRIVCGVVRGLRRTS